MNYIVFDLEWNQSSTSGGVEPGLPFEIIEVGAVKCDETLRVTDRFHKLVKPEVYSRMHPVTRDLLHMDMEQLKKGRPFQEVMESFLAWCGEERMFCTWGTQDLTELQRNMKYFGMEPLGNGPIPFLDGQKLFSLAFEDGKVKRSLEFAIDYLKLKKDIPFHRALSDAAYTARVLEALPDREVFRNVSYDLFHPPVSRKEEVKVQFPTYMKYISREFATKEEAFADREVASSKCYLCCRNLRKKIKWFSSNGKQYYCLAYCEEHGFLKGKIRVRKSEEGKIYIVKTTKFITPQQALEIEQRRDHARELKKKHREAEKRNHRAALNALKN